MKQVIKFKVNGLDQEVFVEPWRSLAEVLRDQLNYTGVKVGCNTGNCGSCTVLIDGKAIKSCLYPAPKANGKEILTIEGLRGENGELHPIQEAFVEHYAIQCGYCTPGMIMATKAMLDEDSDITEEKVRQKLRGNLCRCTGYKKIVEAVLAARDKMAVRGQR